MKWSHWLPTAQQISNAAQLRDSAYRNSTMQQAMGMIVLLGLLAGLLPFALNWFWAARAGTVLPLAEAARSAAALEESQGWLALEMPWLPAAAARSELFQTLAGMDQPLPGWLAAGLSALGEWVNWPLRWLAAWIVYGALVMAANKFLGGHVTLQRFYAATSYAAAPLLLTGLGPIPCLGALASLAGVVWALAVYIRANGDITGMTYRRAAAAVLLPIPFVGVLALIGAGFLFVVSLFLAL